MTSEDEVALLEAVRGGSERAFNVLIDRYQQAVRLFLRGVMSAADAEDAAQETFLAAWTHAASFKGLADVRAWLLSIAWRKAKGMQRGWFRGRRRDTAYHDELAMTPSFASGCWNGASGGTSSAELRYCSVPEWSPSWLTRSRRLQKARTRSRTT